jgi:hypothetical protein
MNAPRRRGRPALVEGQQVERLSTALPPLAYAEVCRIATSEGVSVAAIVRAAVFNFLLNRHSSNSSLSCR